MQSTAATPLAMQEQECPSCHATIPVHPHYVAWCDRCNWNLRPQGAARPRTLFESFYAEIGKRSSQELFGAFAHAESLKPRLTLSKALSFAVAAAVHGLTLGLLVLAGVLLVVGWPRLLVVGLGLLCAVLAWQIRPKMPEFPDSVVSRDVFPTLYLISDRVAQALDTKGVDGIVIDHRFNAAFGLAGWRRKKVLYLGLPLFSILNDQEKIALIAHELAHGVNNDPMSGLFVGSAIRSLNAWYTLLRPNKTWLRRDRRYGRDNPFGLLTLIADFFANILMRLVSFAPWLGAYALSHLLWRESQRAEYLADYLSARIAGTDATLATLEKLHFDDTLALVVQRITLSRSDRSIFDELRQRVAEMPQRELERIRRLERAQMARLDVTHPPTAYRIDLLKAHPVIGPQIEIAPAESEQIERELAQAQKRVQDQLLDIQRRHLYR